MSSTCFKFSYVYSQRIPPPFRLWHVYFYCLHKMKRKSLEVVKQVFPNCQSVTKHLLSNKPTKGKFTRDRLTRHSIPLTCGDRLQLDGILFTISVASYIKL